MQCPLCKKEGAKYLKRFNGKKKHRPLRDDFKATHKCGFKRVM